MNRQSMRMKTAFSFFSLPAKKALKTGLFFDMIGKLS